MHKDKHGKEIKVGDTVVFTIGYAPRNDVRQEKGHVRALEIDNHIIVDLFQHYRGQTRMTMPGTDAAVIPPVVGESPNLCRLCGKRFNINAEALRKENAEDCKSYGPTTMAETLNKMDCCPECTGA